MAFEFQLPPGAQAHLHIRPECDLKYIVAVTVPPNDPTPEAVLYTPGGLGMLLTHDPDVSWPDAQGERLADATLAAGGGLVLAFATLADAMGCHKRLTGGRA